MKSLIILLQLAIVIFLLVLLRFLLQRIRLYFQLNRFAKKYGFRCQILKKTFFLLFNKKNGSNVLLESDSTVYNVRTFGLLRKHCEIHFWHINEYSKTWYFLRSGFVAAQPIGKTNAEKRRQLGDFRVEAPLNLSADKEIIPILLLAPTNAPVRLTKMDAVQVVDLRAGDKIDDVLFADLDFMFRFICKRENKDI